MHILGSGSHKLSHSDGIGHSPCDFPQGKEEMTMTTSTPTKQPVYNERVLKVKIVTPRILIVDDDEPIREAIRMLLEDDEYQVIEANNGLEALTIIQRSPEPLVVLLDLMMPKMNGAEVLQAVATDHVLASRHAFFLITAATRSSAQAAVKLPTNLHVPVLAKPIDIELLLTYVAQASSRLTHRHLAAN